ncbi:MAG: hypothetical protein GX323_06935 [Clostridiales bacterium]|nr:hypothetical protein [Clostridiales bacterium]
MKRKYVYLIYGILCLSFLYGCSNKESSVLELRPSSDTNKEGFKESLIDPCLEASQHEDLSDNSSIKMEVEEGSASPLGLKLTLKNLSKKEIAFNEEYTLEKKLGDSWYKVPFQVDDHRCGGIGYELPFLQSRKLDLNWKDIYGELEPGNYRIIKDFNDSRRQSSYNRTYIASEFALE